MRGVARISTCSLEHNQARVAIDKIFARFGELSNHWVMAILSPNLTLGGIVQCHIAIKVLGFQRRGE